MSTAADIRTQIRELQQMGVSALKRRWAEVFGEDGGKAIGSRIVLSLFGGGVATEYWSAVCVFTSVT